MNDELVKRVPVNVFLADKRSYIYSAAYIYAHNVGNHPLAEVAREADYAACPGVYVGHYAYFASAEHVNGQQPVDLLHRALLNIVGENLCVVIVNRHHCFYTFILMYGAKITAWYAETRQRLAIFMVFHVKNTYFQLVRIIKNITLTTFFFKQKRFHPSRQI